MISSNNYMNSITTTSLPTHIEHLHQPLENVYNFLKRALTKFLESSHLEWNGLLLQNAKGDVKMEKPVQCSKHRMELLRFFCKMCNVPICKDCTMMDHSKGQEYNYCPCTNGVNAYLHSHCISTPSTAAANPSNDDIIYLNDPTDIAKVNHD